MPTPGLPTSRLRNSFLILLAGLMLILTLFEGIRAGADEVLPGPMTRHRDAIAIALTYVQYGKWLGYASYKMINQTLNDNGLNLQDAEVRRLGYKNYFDVMRHPEAVDHAIAAAASLQDVARDGLYYLDGNEKGMAIYYIISFLLFGYHVAGFFYLYVLLLAASAAIFALTFRHSASALLFLVALLAAHLVIVLVCQNLPDDVSTIHGVRFISSLTLPGMFQLMFLSQRRERPGWWNVLGTCIQVLLFALMLNARDTTLWEAIAVFGYVGGWLLLALFRRWPRSNWPALWPAATLLAGVLLLQVQHQIGLNPHYLSDKGTAGHVFWHAVALALNDNPQRTARFGIPDGIPVWDDQVAYMLFDKEIAARGLTRRDFLLPDDRDWRLRTSAPEWDFNWVAYDGVMRDIVLRQIAAAPFYAVQSFFFYQPMRAIATVATLVGDALRYSLSIWPLLIAGLAIAWKASFVPGPRVGWPLTFAILASSIPTMFVAVHPIRVVDLLLTTSVALLWMLLQGILHLRSLGASPEQNPKTVRG